MKKVFLILILFLSCYFIYNFTIDKKVYYLTIGDSLSKGTNEYGIVTKGYSDYIKDYLNSNKILKEYDKVIVEMKDCDVNTKGKTIYKVGSFLELIDARDTIEKPILFVRINNIKSIFVKE